MGLEAKQRKADQRRRDRLAGWVEVTVKVAVDRVDDVRNYAASLPPPPTFGDKIEKEAKGARAEIQKIYDTACEHRGKRVDPSSLTSDPIVLAALSHETSAQQA